MPRWVIAALVAGAFRLGAQNIAPPKPPEPPPAAAPVPETKPSADALRHERPKPAAPAANSKEEVPPEEDASLAVEHPDFNPLEAQKDITVGNEYYKKGNYRAASNRFKLATQYDDSNREAWLRLGEASEKLKDFETVKTAYTRYLAVAGDAKNAAEIRKKLEKLK